MDWEWRRCTLDAMPGSADGTPANSKNWADKRCITTSGGQHEKNHFRFSGGRLPRHRAQRTGRQSAADLQHVPGNLHPGRRTAVLRQEGDRGEAGRPASARCRYRQVPCRDRHGVSRQARRAGKGIRRRARSRQRGLSHRRRLGHAGAGSGSRRQETPPRDGGDRPPVQRAGQQFRGDPQWGDLPAQGRRRGHHSRRHRAPVHQDRRPHQLHHGAHRSRQGDAGDGRSGVQEVARDQEVQDAINP